MARFEHALALIRYNAPLYGMLAGTWIQGCTSSPVQRWIQLSVALEQTTLPLEYVFPDADGQLFDLFASERMSQPAVRRARSSSAVVPASPATPDTLPATDESSDLTVVTLAAHELRRRSDREALFRELARITRVNGSIVVVEHLRDLPALLAFGKRGSGRELSVGPRSADALCEGLLIVPA